MKHLILMLMLAFTFSLTTNLYAQEESVDEIEYVDAVVPGLAEVADFDESIAIDNETIDEVTEPIVSDEALTLFMNGKWLYSFSALSVLVMMITERLKRYIKKLKSRYIAIIVSVILTFAIWSITTFAINIDALLAGLQWWQTLIYAVVLSLTSSGIFSTDVGKQILTLLRLRTSVDTK